MECAICNGEFAPSWLRRKTCSTPCATEHKRRTRYARRKKRRKKCRRRLTAAQLERQRERYRRDHPRHCRTCGVSVGKSVRYCSLACRPPPKPKPKPVRQCHGCGVATQDRAFYCDLCGTAATKRSANRKREICRIRNAATKIKIDAAVRVMRALRGQPEPVAPITREPEPYQNRCIVCGIAITGMRKRACSDTCRISRTRDRSWAYYRGVSLPALPPRPPKTVVRKNCPSVRARAAGVDRERVRAFERVRRQQPKRRAAKRAYDANRRAIYQAFKELGFIPTATEEASP